MGLHKQARSVLMKPSASVTISHLDKIHGPVVFVGPIVIFDAARTDIHEDHAAWTQEGHHSPGRRADVTIAVARISIG